MSSFSYLSLEKDIPTSSLDVSDNSVPANSVPIEMSYIHFTRPHVHEYGESTQTWCGECVDTNTAQL